MAIIWFCIKSCAAAALVSFHRQNDILLSPKDTQSDRPTSTDKSVVRTDKLLLSILIEFCVELFVLPSLPYMVSEYGGRLHIGIRSLSNLWVFVHTYTHTMVAFQGSFIETHFICNL